MKKRVIMMLLASMMVVGTFSGCGQSLAAEVGEKQEEAEGDAEDEESDEEEFDDEEFEEELDDEYVEYEEDDEDAIELEGDGEFTIDEDGDVIIDGEDGEEMEEVEEVAYASFDEVKASLEAGVGIAEVKLANCEHPILFVADETYEYEGVNAASDVSVYAYDSDGKVYMYGWLSSDSENMPITVSDEYFYVADDEYVEKDFVDETQGYMLSKEEAMIEEEDGKTTYYVYSYDDDFEGEVDDDTVFKRLMQEYKDATVLSFEALSK